MKNRATKSFFRTDLNSRIVVELVVFNLRKFLHMEEMRGCIIEVVGEFSDDKIFVTNSKGFNQYLNSSKNCQLFSVISNPLDVCDDVRVRLHKTTIIEDCCSINRSII